MDAKSKQLLKSLTTQIEQWLTSPFGSNEPASLYEPVKYILSLGGKRIRPLLALLAAGIVDKEPSKAKEVALALEYLHNFTLMHDDIMDSAESRRGQASVHLKWDESVAILSGDVMYTMATQILLSNKDIDSEIQIRLVERFLAITRHVCEGQAYDMELPATQEAQAEDYMHMIEGKTAALIGGSLQLGAIAAGANKNVSDEFYEIGLNAGLAFQLQDDLLDLTGSKTGKKHCGDIYEKKKTWIYLQALRKANPADKQKLRSIYEPDYQVQADDTLIVLRIFEKLGIFADCEVLISSYYNKSIQLLESFESSTYKNALIALMHSLLKRDH